MKNRSGLWGTLLTLLSAFTAPVALAVVTSTVVDVPFAGDSQRFLLVKPEAPTAVIVNIQGGDGILGIRNDGTMDTVTATCSPIGRNRQAIADRGFAVALIDATSAGAVRNVEGILAAIRYLRERHDVPLWVTGGSASTLVTAFVASSLSSEIPGGVMLFAPDRVTTSMGAITRPALVVSHTLDPQHVATGVYNALVSAPVRERVSFSGGSNAGCGYHLLNGLDAEFVAALSGFIDRNNTFTATPELNVQGLWWRSPANSENGWGVNLTQQGETLFATWFTYDTDGSPMWLVMSAGARIADRTYSGTLYRTTGPAFSAATFDASRVVLAPVGSATFTFGDSSNGTFAYTVNGVTQSKPITRLVYGTSTPTCTAGGSHGTPPNYQSLWWRSPANSEPGWGINVTHQGDTLFATWFTYAADGRGMWLVMSEGLRTAAGTYSGTLYRTSGPSFSAATWDNSRVALTPAGTGTFAFADAENGTFSYTVDGVTQSKPITRLVYATPATVCR